MKQETCNRELVNDVSRATGVKPAIVRDVLHEYTKFISEMIREGAFETMLVPYFGKFEPKIKQLQRRYNQRGKQRKQYARTIPTDSGLQSGAEQTLDSTNT